MKRHLSIMIHLILLASTLSMMISSPALSAEAIRGTGTLWILETGDVKGVYSIEVDNPPQEIKINVVKGGIHVGVYCGAEPIPYEYDAVSGALSFLASCRSVRIEVYSSEITSKEGSLWVLKLNPQSLPIEVVLPQNAVLVSAKPETYRITVRDTRIALVYSAGTEIEIEYVIAPVIEEERPILLYIALAGLVLIVAVVIAYTVYRMKFRSEKK